MLLMIEILSMTLRTLNYGNHGIFLVTGNAGFVSSAVAPRPRMTPASLGNLGMVSQPCLRLGVVPDGTQPAAWVLGCECVENPVTLT